MSKFSHVRFDVNHELIRQSFRSKFENLAEEIQKLKYGQREKFQALVRLEEAYMWIGKAVRESQMGRRDSSNDEHTEGQTEYQAGGSMQPYLEDERG